LTLNRCGFITKVMFEFEQDYFEKVLLPSLKTVPLNYYVALTSLLDQTGLTPKGLRLLDYGCGDGHFVKYVFGRGVDAWGVDISHYSKTVSVIPERHNILADGKIPNGFGREHYDLCFCCGVLQYMEEEEIETFLKYVSPMCDKIWIETLTDCSNEIPATEDSYNKPLRTRTWYNKIFAANGFKITRVKPVYYKNAWLLEVFIKLN